MDYDAGKKISGIKRHITVDTQGLPHAIYVTTAEVTWGVGDVLAGQDGVMDSHQGPGRWRLYR